MQSPHSGLSDQDKKIILEISLALNKTADENLSQELQKITVAHARGYLHAFAAHARPQDALLGFFVVRLLTEHR